MKTRKIIILALALVLLAGCAQLGIKKSWSNMTPKEKAIVMNDVYNKQFAAVQAYTLGDLDGSPVWKPDLSRDLLNYLKAKREILNQVWNPLKIYSYMARSGEIPPAVLEAEVMLLINKLAGGDSWTR